MYDKKTNAKKKSPASPKAPVAIKAGLTIPSNISFVVSITISLVNSSVSDNSGKSEILARYPFIA